MLRTKEGPRHREFKPKKISQQAVNNVLPRIVNIPISQYWCILDALEKVEEKLDIIIRGCVPAGMQRGQHEREA